MTSPKIVCVVPTIRPEQHAKFVKAWSPLFEKHGVTLITVWDGEKPEVSISATTWEDIEKEYAKVGGHIREDKSYTVGDPLFEDKDANLFCRFTDACRNLGFVLAAKLGADYILTLDDDVEPPSYDHQHSESRGDWLPYPIHDPIQAHLGVLSKRVPVTWLNTAHDTELYLRGVPYGIRDESPVMLSHGVWVGTPDFDGETQLRLENRMTNTITSEVRLRDLPYSLPYYVGPIPKGVLFPLCGMNVMVKREALPYFYFAPMGPDTGITQSIKTCGSCGSTEVAWHSLNYKWYCRKCQTGCGSPENYIEQNVSSLHRFADIWMGVFLKKEFDRLGWACYTGASTVLHTRASDAKKNFEQEKLGREWNERVWNNSGNRFVPPTDYQRYFDSYANKRQRYADLIKSILGEKM